MARTRTQPEPTEGDQEPEDMRDEIDADERERAGIEQATRTPTVVEALSRVMGDVQSVSKNSRNTSQNFNFRGIDAVMNAVGPALREHGVVVVPTKTKYDVEEYQSSQGKRMKGVTLTVTFRFYGPAGDFIEATATGESSDAGDKAMPKAHSVAFRTMLLQALCIPTDEPDPDLEAHERASIPFQGSTGGEPRARERRQEKPPYNFPKDWKELHERFASLLGGDEAAVWVSQAIQVFTGETIRVPEMDEQMKRAVWEMLTKVLRSLDEELKVDPGAFPPPTRNEIMGEFAKHLDGQGLAGPPWALSGEEAESGYPAKNKSEEDRREPTEEEIAEAKAALDAEPEMSEEEIAAAQASLDEEAAQAASSDD